MPDIEKDFVSYVSEINPDKRFSWEPVHFDPTYAHEDILAKIDRVLWENELPFVQIAGEHTLYQQPEVSVSGDFNINELQRRNARTDQVLSRVTEPVYVLAAGYGGIETWEAIAQGSPIKATFLGLLTGASVVGAYFTHRLRRRAGRELKQQSPQM